MLDYYPPAKPRNRILAATVDFGGATVLWVLLASIGFSVFGMFIALAYFVFRDALEGQSLGKRFFRLRVLNLENHQPIGAKDSFLRNIVFIVPLLGYAALAVECYMAFGDADLRRWGDHFAQTLVIQESQEETKQTSENHPKEPEPLSEPGSEPDPGSQEP